jgi:hypothetical protein
MHRRKTNVHLDLKYDDGEVRSTVSVSRVFIAARRWVEPPGPAFGRPDDKLRDVNQWSFCEDDGVSRRLTSSCAP